MASITQRLDRRDLAPAAVAEIRVRRQRDRPLRAGPDTIADLVRDWSGDHLRDDVSLVAIERYE